MAESVQKDCIHFYPKHIYNDCIFKKEKLKVVGNAPQDEWEKVKSEYVRNAPQDLWSMMMVG
ncbi:MAG: hypothetical protein C4545_07880 [Anaerolineaceae bacterium]|jgi:hypothetical protein|nr:MAG: hypothetical protein C4545_07880 [Anaerolineaceae bacterium]